MKPRKLQVLRIAFDSLQRYFPFVKDQKRRYSLLILGTVLAGSLHLGPFPLLAQPSADRTLQREIEKACRD
ncbi:MAG TPA: hypothetical protein VJB38_05005, partial [Bacteroidota bacterium]|nr:hypothetical protein [Bacteroidota bacterium]